MSRIYTKEFLDELKRRANLVEIASSFIELKKIGANYLAHCPFHDDRTPSFQIKPETNTFYCHGCGAGSANHSHVKSSDVICFVQHMMNCTFPEAVEYLAKLTNTPLPALTPQEQQKEQQRRKWIEYCNQANETFRNNLKNNQKALFYLGNRGMTNLDIEIWQLGFGGEVQYPEFKNVRNRITFPLFDYDGEIVSFTGRVPFSQEMLDKINEKQQEEGKSIIPKYKDRKNFDKRNYLYGIHIAKDYIRQWKTAILVEGWTDVISLHRHGAQHAVSSMGVALSHEQVKLLKRSGAERVIIMRDGDLAGLMACERDSKILAEHGIECFILPLPDGMDPDTLCLEYGYYNDGLSKYINKYMQSVNQYKITKIYKETQDDILYHYAEINSTQKERLSKVIDVLLTIEDPIELDIYIRQVSELFVVSYESIKQHLKIRKKLQMSENKSKRRAFVSNQPAFQQKIIS